jgi:hypothetical protein
MYFQGFDVIPILVRFNISELHVPFRPNLLSATDINMT